jgi:UDP-glucose 4-epimerase
VVHVLVTGGFGFIGSHLVERLLTDPGTSVHVVDDLSSSPLQLDGILEDLGHPDRLSYEITTLLDFLGRPDVPAFDRVYHLASPVGPAGVLQHAGQMVRQIVDDTYALIEFVTRVGARLLDVSTSEVYGGGQEGLCAEGAPKIVPARTTVRLEYAVAKLAAETALINTTTVTDLDAVIVRPFNVAGPRQSPRGGFVLPRFLRQAHFGEDITVFGDGRALRAFTHVRDVVDGLVRTMDKGQRGDAYNIGNPANRISILELAESVREVVPSSSTIKFIDPKTIYGPLYEEANDKFPEASRAMNELGWRPSYSVQDTIEDAYAHLLRLLERGLADREG